MGMLALIFASIFLWVQIASRKGYGLKVEGTGSLVIVVVFVGIWVFFSTNDTPSIPEAKKELVVPKEVAQWCEYNTFENAAYDEYTHAHDAPPARATIREQNRLHKEMMDEINPKLRAKRRQLFGEITDEQMQLIGMKALNGDWWQKYCLPLAQKNWVKVTNSAWDGSVSQVVDWIKKNANDADSFEAIEWSPVQKTESGYLVRCKFKAKNAYGAYVTSNAIFELDNRGNVTDVSGLN